MEFILILMIAVSLSMDAFSLSLAYGTLSLEKKEMKQLSIIVGIYHFVMPLIGMTIGSMVLKFLPVHPDVVICIVLTIIGIQMMIESTKEEKIDKKMNLVESLIFGFAVSVDSFSVGVGLKGLTNHFVLAALLFSLFSFLFTKLGLRLGKKCHERLGNLATRVGGIGLILIGLICLL